MKFQTLFQLQLHAQLVLFNSTVVLVKLLLGIKSYNRINQFLIFRNSEIIQEIYSL